MSTYIQPSPTSGTVPINIRLTLVSDVAATIDHIDWYPGDGTSQTTGQNQTSNLHLYEMEGSFQPVGHVYYTYDPTTCYPCGGQILNLKNPSSPITTDVNVSVSGVTISYSITASGTGVGSIFDISVSFGDGTVLNTQSGSHTYTKSGSYTIKASYRVNANNIPTSYEKAFGPYNININNPGPGPGPNPIIFPTGVTGENVFSAKPMLISPSCNGNVRITASIEDIKPLVNTIRSKPYSNDFSWSSTATTNIAAGATQIFDLGHESATSMDVCNYIPAFYDSGQIIIQYTVSSSGAYDVKWNALMYIPTADKPSWYPYNTASDNDVMLSMISSNNSDSYNPSGGKNTSYTQYFNVSKWPGMPPLKLDVHKKRSVKMAVLNKPRFLITAKNDYTKEVKLSNINVYFSFAYNETGILTNIPISKQSNRYDSHIFFAPNAPATVEISNTTNFAQFSSYAPFYVWGILDGYNTTGMASEFVRVYGHYDEIYDADGKGSYYNYPTTLELTQLLEAGDLIDAPVFRSSQQMSSHAWITVANAPSNSEFVNVITPQRIAASDEYRTIDVKSLNGESVFDGDTTFVIETTPNEGNEELITKQDLIDNLKYIKFYDKSVDFATHVEVKRSDVNPMFYERMGQTYKDSVTLQSRVTEPLYFVEFTFNDYATYIPIGNGQTLEFSDDLLFATDGKRSSEFIVFSTIIPNKINVKNPTEHKYKVRFNVEHDKFKDTWVVDEEYLSVNGIV